MALPKLSNDRPVYEMVVPSTQETVKYRPFLVKEQKNMLVAFESQDPKQILDSMLISIESCVPGINLKKLATFDIDYMFTQVRSKSVGETSTILYACVECKEENEVKVNLQDIQMEGNQVKPSLIKINDDISVQMKFPTYNDVIAQNVFSSEKTSPTAMLMDSIKSCMYAVQTQEENILIRDESAEEVDTFINSLTNEQLEKLTDFVENLPNLSHDVTFNCKKCQTENKITLRGLQDFF